MASIAIGNVFVALFVENHREFFAPPQKKIKESGDDMATLKADVYRQMVTVKGGVECIQTITERNGKICEAVYAA